LKGEARNATERLAVSKDFLDDFLGAADQERALWTSLSVETGAGDGRPLSSRSWWLD
jgi:hypothetical protein